MKIIDSFIFGFEYELDLLDLRLEYLADTVDYFVLVEARFTHLGDDKPAFFDLNKDRFVNFSDKIIHVIVDEPDRKLSLEQRNAATGAFWYNEIHHRNKILEGLNSLNLNEDDIIVLSDSDEFPSKDAIEYYKNNNLQGMHCALQDMYYYYMNFKASYNWNGPQISRWSTYKEHEPQIIRKLRHSSPKIPAHGGWHFSYMGGADAILKKISSVSEHHAHKRFKDENILSEYLDKNVLHFNNAKLSKVDIFNESYYPQNIVTHYNELITKGFIKE